MSILLKSGKAVLGLLFLAGIAGGFYIQNPPVNDTRPFVQPNTDNPGRSIRGPHVIEIDGTGDKLLSKEGFDWDQGGDHVELAMSFWMYRTTDDGFGYLSALGPYVDGATMISYRMYQSGDAIRVDVAAGTDFQFWRMTTSELIPVGTWTHFAWSCSTNGTDVANFRAWFNGVEDESITSENAGAHVAPQRDTIYVAPIDSLLISIGGMVEYAGTREMRSTTVAPINVAGVRIMNDVPTTDDVQSLMVSTAAGWNTTAHWRMDPGVGQTVTDVVGSADMWRGRDSLIATDDPAWGDYYGSISASGPVIALGWMWGDVAWLFGSTAYAADDGKVRYSWACDEHSALRKHWPWQTTGVHLGPGIRRICKVSRDTVRVFSHMLRADQVRRIHDATSQHRRFWVRGFPPDTLEAIPVE